MNFKAKNVIFTVVILVLLFVGAYLAYSRYAQKDRTVPPTEPTATIAAAVASAAPSAGESAETGATQPDPLPTASNLAKATDIKLETLDGRTVALSDYEGKKAVVLNFWASWCPPCRGEMPEFSKQAELLGEDKVVFLMVDLTDGARETKETAQKYLTDNKLTFKNVLLDTQFAAAEAYSVTGIPATIFINKDGYIVKSYTGAIDEGKLIKGIEMVTK